jgi:hypothetical protein
MKDAAAWSLAASMLALTAAALIGSPSWKVAPERILNVQDFPSALALQDSAIAGEYASAEPAGFFQSRGSYMLPM